MNLEVFHFEEGKENFESFANQNGFTYWSARKLMSFLGYTKWESFNKVISRAMATCNTLGIDLLQNFEPVSTEIDGRLLSDFKISRFACYLISMNGSNQFPQVAKAQAYFAHIAGAIHSYQLEAEKVERLQVRAEVSEREKTLSGVAFAHGLSKDGYGLFQNAGYRGMYNMNLSQLKSFKGVPSGRTLLDFMGKDELAANLFRITQTELKIKEDNVYGQTRLENTANAVGKKVRQTMVEISGIAPENMQLEEDIKKVKSGLKKANKTLKQLGAKKSAKKKK